MICYSHRSATDCLLFTQPLTEPYLAPLVYSSLPATIQWKDFQTMYMVKTPCMLLRNTHKGSQEIYLIPK